MFTLAMIVIITLLVIGIKSQNRRIEAEKIEAEKLKAEALGEKKIIEQKRIMFDITYESIKVRINTLDILDDYMFTLSNTLVDNQVTDEDSIKVKEIITLYQDKVESAKAKFC